MNLRSFTTISAVAMFVLGGCIITTTDNGKGGSGNAAGGSGNTGNEGGNATGGTGGTGGSAGAGVGGAGGGMCVNTCAEAATDTTVPPCAGSAAAKLFDALATCTCGDAMGMGAKCLDVCKATTCAGMMADTACSTCVFDKTTGCGVEFTECSNN